MVYLKSPSTDPYFNLALEQYVFDELDRAEEYFMLWQNDNTIVVGKHQNTFAEINAAYVKEHGVKVARRLSGGGAVYHDMGNVNFTFIMDYADGNTFDFGKYCKLICEALAAMGIPAEVSGRNDMTVDGKKFSGNSQYMKQNRVMHHGTILFDSNLEIVQQALNVPKDKIESKGLKSVRSRVTNIRPYLNPDMPVEQFMDVLADDMIRSYRMKAHTLTETELAAVNRLRDDVYATWDWNYGESPKYQIIKERRVEGCGKLEIHMNVDAGVVQEAAFYGDYFGNGDPTELKQRLAGCRLEEDALRAALDGVEISRYFNHMDLETFLRILLQ